MSQTASNEAGSTKIGYHRDHAAGEAKALQTKTANFSVSPKNDGVVILNGGTASVDATLPAVANVPVGQMYMFVASDISNTVRLVGNGAENINGANTHTFSTQYEGAILWSTGTEWFMIEYFAALADGAVTPAKTEQERVLTADTNGTVAATDRVIYISTTIAGSRTLTFGDTAIAGHRVVVIMTAQTTGTYATVGIDSGEVTFNTAGQQAEFVYNETADTWQQLTADTADILDGQVTPVKLEGITTVAADGDHTVVATDRVIFVSETDTTQGTITFGDTAVEGHVVTVIMTAATTGSYITSGIDSGEVTFTAANQAATFVYNETTDKWFQLDSATPNIKDGAITPLMQEGLTIVAADAAHTVAATDRIIQVSETDAGAHTITFGDTAVQGQIVHVHMTAATTGSYATSGIDDGEVTFDAAEEAASFYYDETNDLWRTLNLHGATQA